MKEKETASFECEISKPNLKVKWLKNGEEIKPSKRFDMAVMDNRYLLTIREAELDDESKYTIVAEEGVESTAQLTVEGRIKHNYD